MKLNGALIVQQKGRSNGGKECSENAAQNIYDPRLGVRAFVAEPRYRCAYVGFKARKVRVLRDLVTRYAITEFNKKPETLFLLNF